MKKTHKAQQQKKQKPQARSRTDLQLVLGCAILASVSVYLFVQSRKSTGSTHQATRAPVENREVPETMDLNGIRHKQYALLQTIVAQDPEGLELLAFFDRYARYGRLLTGGMLAEIPTSSVGQAAENGDPMNFTVVVASRGERVQNGVTSVAPWEFEHTQALLFVPPDWSDQSDEAAGALFAHELRHAYDHAHHLQPVEATHRQMIEGEWRAYALELRLLDHANRGRIGSAMEAILAGRTEWPTPPGTCLYMTDLSTEEKQRFFDAMPSIVSEDLPPLIVLLPIGLNLRLAQRHAAGVEGEVTCLERFLDVQAQRSAQAP